MRAIRRLRARQPGRKRPGRKGPSNIDMSFEMLRRAKAPLHVDDLIVALAQAYGVQPARDSLVSALSKKVAA